jgi:proteic killer suppression protein
VLLRITQLRALVNLAEATQLSSLGFHALRGKRAGQFAVDLPGGMRLVIRPLPHRQPAQSILELAAIVAIEIVEVTNYHD